MMNERQILGKYIQEYSVRNKSAEALPVYSVTNDKGFCQGYFDKDVSSKDKSGYKIVPRGYFAYNPSRINVGSVACQKAEDRVIVSPLYVVFGVSGELYNPYLMYFLKSPYANAYINAYARGAVRNNFGIKKMRELTLPVPSLASQQGIVEELDAIHAIIDAKNEQLRELDNLAQAVFYSMFGDPIANEKGWSTSKFGDAFKLKSGDGLSAKSFIDGPYPVYGGNGISGCHNAYNMDGEFIIIGRVGALCGNVRCVSGQFWLTDNAFQLFYDKDTNNIVFLTKLLEYLNLNQYANHSAQPVISNVTLKDVNIILPPLDLQQAFASKISAIEQQKELIRASIAETEALLAARMQHYFD